MTLIAFEGVAIGTAMPAIGVDLDGLGLYAWGFNAFVVASLVSMVVAGTWCDRLGPRLPMLVGIAVFAGGAVLAGFAPTMPIFIAARGIQGLGSGAMIVAIYVLIARAFDESLRPRAFSLLAASWVVPGLVGPLIAGWLTETVTWRLVFWLVPVVLLLPVILLRGVLSQYDGGTDRPSTPGRNVAAIAAAVGLTLAMAGLVRPPGAWFIAAAFVVAGLALLLPAARQLLPAGALRFSRGLPTTVMMRGILAAAFFSAEAFAPLALVEQRGLTVTVAGLLLSLAAIGWLTGSLIQSRIPGDLDRARVVTAGALVVTASLVALPLCLVPAIPAMVAAPIFLVGSVGMGLCFPSIGVQMMRLSPVDQQGANSSALQISDAVMSALGLGLAGAVHAYAVASGGATNMTYVTIWFGAAAVALVGAIVAGRMRQDAPCLTS